MPTQEQYPMTNNTQTPQWQAVTPHLCSLGESPFWHPDEQMLYWVDIAGKQILRANIYMGTVQTWDMPSEPGCIAPTQGGGLVIALRHGVFLAPTWGADLIWLATLDYDPSQMRANDGKCDALGRFWVGTIDETRSKLNAALFCIDARDSAPGGLPQVSCKIGPSAGATTANGLAFSPDNHTLYWANTPSHTVQAWDFDKDTANISAQRVFASFAPKPPGWLPDAAGHEGGAYGGRPDGATVDVQGNYWVAMYEGQRICQFASDGQLLASLATPMTCPTMVCLGGEDLQTLYVTSAQPKGTGAANPLAGAVVSTRVDVPGLRVNFFQEGKLS